MSKSRKAGERTPADVDRHRASGYNPLPPPRRLAMPDDPPPLPPPPAQLARLLRQPLASLEAAGVEWLPASRDPLPLFTAASTSPVPVAAVEEDPDGPEARRRELTVLTEQVAECTRCAELASSRTQTVFGVGRLDPEVCF